jgi:Putative auto-transporter adhesin, head GIN domain
MKKITLLIATVLLTTVSFSQKKEKIKGSKVVVTVKYEVDAFSEVEVEDNLEVIFVKGDKNAVEIETDENIQTAINHQTYGKSLRLNTNKEISSFKKLEVRVIYTDSLKLISVRNEVKLNGGSEIKLKALTIKTFDYSKSVITVNASDFKLFANDKSKVDINIKSVDAIIELSKNAELTGKISSTNLKLDLYQKSKAEIQGDCTDMKLRLDNDAEFDGKKMASKTLELTAEAKSNCKVNTNGDLAISASGKAEIEIYGQPKIEIKKFADDAILQKKSKE